MDAFHAVCGWIGMVKVFISALAYQRLSNPVRSLSLLLVEAKALDFGTASKEGASIPMLPPIRKGGNGRNQPEQCAGQVYPHGVFHALDVSVAMGVLVDVQLGELTCQYRALPRNDKNSICISASPLSPLSFSPPGCFVQRILKNPNVPCQRRQKE
jgi:hypothetical protein